MLKVKDVEAGEVLRGGVVVLSEVGASLCFSFT